MSGASVQSKGRNRVRAFDILRSRRQISRADLARETGLSRASISNLADELLRAGVVEETGLGDSTGGRPPVLLRFRPEAALAIGARMRDYEWGIVATDLDAQIVYTLTTRINGGSPEAAIEALGAGVAELKSRLDPQLLLPAIGLGTPGLVDSQAGVIKTAVDVSWFDVPIREMAESVLETDVYVANRSRAAALVELWRGAEAGIQDLIYVSIGTGVAAGIIHEGEIYAGANSSAGELGHITILPDGPLCPCGNRGCLQQLVSGPSIANRAREKLRQGHASILAEMAGLHPERVTSEIVFEAAQQGDPLAEEIVDEVAAYLGIALANLINLFNPELIVLGGPVGQNSAVLLEPLMAEVRRRSMAYPLSAVRFTTSSLGADAGAAGAATMVLQRASDLIVKHRAARSK